MRTIVFRACVITVAVACGTPVFVSAQTQFPLGRSPLFQAAVQAAGGSQTATATPQQTSSQTPPGPTRRLTADEAVKLAVENNLGIQIARIDPQIQDLTVLQARTNWSPSLTSTFQRNSTEAPNQNIIGGGATISSSDAFQNSVGVQQNLRWGASYNVAWNSSRFESNSNISA